MFKIGTINLKFLIILTLLIFTFISQSSKNTYQTITRPIPPVFNISLKSHDIVKITVFNTVGTVSIAYRVEQKGFQIGVTQFCGAGENVSLEFISQWTTKSLLIIYVQAYEFSYQITINGTVWKKQNFLTDFLNDKLTYAKHLKVRKYDIRVTYHSKKVKEITLKFMGREHTVHANVVNNIKVDFYLENPFYEIQFQIEQGAYRQIDDVLFEIKIELPNEMLKGCDGTNIYDSRIRACSSNRDEVLDFLQLHKFGSYPTFEVLEQSKTVLKLTILETTKWPQFASDLSLKIYLANTTDQQALQSMSQSQMESKYSLQQVCVMKKTLCNFIFKLQPGNYTIIPFILSTETSFIYLLERGDGKKVIESFYSILPTFDASRDKLKVMGGFFQFVSHQQKITEIIFESSERFLLGHHIIFGRSKTQKQEGRYMIQMIDVQADTVYNLNPNKASVYVQTEPNSFYIMGFMLLSQEKFKKAQPKSDHTIASNNQNADNNIRKDQSDSIDQQDTDISDDNDFDFEDEGDDGDWTIDDVMDLLNGTDFIDANSNYDDSIPIDRIQIDSLVFETDHLQISIRNGKFPYKKLQEPTLTEIIIEKNKSSSTSIFSSVEPNLVIIIGVIGGVVLLAILICVCWKLKGGMTQSGEKGKQLVEENQTSSVNVESAIGSTQSSIEISQIVSTQTLS